LRSSAQDVVVHSCFAGTVEPKLLGDLGGVPGLSLGMGCRLFCAPVAEVSTSTAGSLQGHLFSDMGRERLAKGTLLP